MQVVKVNSKQQNAEAYAKTLSSLNEAQVGQVQVTYLDEQGHKRSGYVDLLDLSLEVNGKEVTVGQFLAELMNLSTKTLKQVNNLAHSVESVGSDLLIVKTDDLGYVKQIFDFNAKNDLVVGAQPLASDYAKGYYYVSKGKIVESEERKLELFPDFV